MPVDYKIKVAEATKLEVTLPRMSPLKHTVEECMAIGGSERAMAPVWLGSRGEKALMVDIPPMTIDVLHEPYLFGGHVTQIHGHRHESGQLLLNSALKLDVYSYGIMDGSSTLPVGLCDGIEDRFTGDVSNEVRLAGDFFFVGSAHIHFGHIIVEGLARLWGAPFVRNQMQDPKFLIYETIVRDFAFEMFDLAGLSREMIIGSPPLCRPQRLFVPCTSMSTHNWIALQQADVWDNIGARANRRMSDVGGAKKVYLSRSEIKGRSLRNELEVEALFVSKGFTIIHPQSLSVMQQVKIAYDAEILAGCVGSQMYLAAFQKRGGRNIVLAPENFFLPDDILISHSKSHELSVFFGGLVDQFHREGWDVDLAELRRFLNELSFLR